MTIDSAARIPLYARIEIQGVFGHPCRKAYPGQDRIAWSGYNPPVSMVVPPRPALVVLVCIDVHCFIVFCIFYVFISVFNMFMRLCVVLVRVLCIEAHH